MQRGRAAKLRGRREKNGDMEGGTGEVRERREEIWLGLIFVCSMKPRWN